ncbi:MAG: prephenate dehydratase [Evtepia sp.]|uniref:prephenate dehydratase n=1 Tax=Evtepia sp. TaxID=2773933 RepID=UPI002A76392B|nr:prephenate dehydratase [Evtepia sp.]MDY3015286.1 prephenate dehydratase [Evtepia sp.]
MQLEDLRKQIDEIDQTLVQAFAQRMQVVAQVSKTKQEQGLPVLDPARERQKLADIAAQLPPEMEQYGYALWSILFEVSRSYQSSLRPQPSPLRQEIAASMDQTPNLFPPSATVACQGVEGAYSQLACEKLFKHPQVMYFGSFDSVFSAIENGFCQYGVLPLENSTAGSVKQVYDLMLRHSFKIVRSTRLKVDHNLVAKKGTKLEDVKEIFSHPQAISQCSSFLEKLGKDVKVTPCENTAAAAEAVDQSQRTDVAAIASYNCVALYGLERLAADIQDRSNNYTRFICISKKLEIYPGADKTSLMMVLPHRPGALYQVLARFYTLGLNLIKLESRPLPDREFEFMFYFDLETSVYSEEFIRMIDDLSTISQEFQYLGSYSEVI